MNEKCKHTFSLSNIEDIGSEKKEDEFLRKKKTPSLRKKEKNENNKNIKYKNIKKKNPGTIFIVSEKK